MATKKLSNKKIKLGKLNKGLFLQGKPFTLPRRLDIHRGAYYLYQNEDSTRKETLIFKSGFSSGTLGSYTSAGRTWLCFQQTWLNQTNKSQVAFHELDFDIEVDQWGKVTKEIDGETITVEYDSNY